MPPLAHRPFEPTWPDATGAVGVGGDCEFALFKWEYCLQWFQGYVGSNCLSQVNVEEMPSLDGLVADGGEVELFPWGFVLGTASGIDCDGLSHLNDGRVRCFCDEEQRPGEDCGSVPGELGVGRGPGNQGARDLFWLPVYIIGARSAEPSL